MIQKALEYLVGLRKNQTYTIDGQTYSDNRLHYIGPHVDRPDPIAVAGLDSIVKLVKAELPKVDPDMLPVYIQVKSEKDVQVFTSTDKYMQRNHLYSAFCDVPGFKDGYREYEKAIIELRSRFAPGDGVTYLLDLLSRISKENNVTTSDNGVTQQVEARTGVSLKAMVEVKPRVALCPYRTFLEVQQPESEFLVRLDRDGNVGLFEADGGAWKLKAKENIEWYFRLDLKEEIEAGKVVVMT